MEPRDLVDGVLDRRQHPQAEQVDLEEAGVGARVLVPLADLTPGHRRRLDGDEVDQRPRRDHHPARVLRDVARQAGDLPGQGAERIPARAGVLSGDSGQLFADCGRVPAVGDACEPLQLSERQPERLADIADRAAAAVGGEARDERRVLVAVALDHGHDQLLADVAGEVEIDVGDGRELVVQEAADRKACLDGIDVREAGQVADERADTGAASTPRRQHVPWAAGAAHLERALPRQLEHLPVEQEEPRQPEPPDQGQLVLQAAARLCL